MSSSDDSNNLASKFADMENKFADMERSMLAMMQLMQESMTEMKTQITAMDETIDSDSHRHRDMEHVVDDVTKRVANVDSNVNSIHTTVDALQTTVTALSTDMNNKLKTIVDDHDSTVGVVDNVTTRVANVDFKVTGIHTTVDDLQTTVTALSTDFNDKLEALANRIKPVATPSSSPTELVETPPPAGDPVILPPPKPPDPPDTPTNVLTSMADSGVEPGMDAPNIANANGTLTIQVDDDLTIRSRTSVDPPPSVHNNIGNYGLGSNNSARGLSGNSNNTGVHNTSSRYRQTTSSPRDGPQSNRRETDYYSEDPSVSHYDHHPQHPLVNNRWETDNYDSDDSDDSSVSHYDCHTQHTHPDTLSDAQIAVMLLPHNSASQTWLRGSNTDGTFVDGIPTLTETMCVTLNISRDMIDEVMTVHATAIRYLVGDSQLGIRRKEIQPTKILSSAALENIRPSDLSLYSFATFIRELGLFLEEFGIPITPFNAIKVENGAAGLCLPGLGITGYNKCGRALLHVVTHLVPDDDNIAALVKIVRAGSKNGYELLFRLGESVAGLFDATIFLNPPRWKNDDSLVSFGEHCKIYFFSMEQRRQGFSQTEQLIFFLENVRGTRYIHYASGVLRDVRALPQTASGFLPPHFSIDSIVLCMERDTRNSDLVEEPDNTRPYDDTPPYDDTSPYDDTPPYDDDTQLVTNTQQNY